MQVKAILFDLDGTLVDTEPSAVRAVTTCFEEWGLEFPPADAGRLTGRTWRAVFEEFSRKYRIPVSVEQACLSATKAYLAILREELLIIPGSANAVRELSRVWPLGLVTGSTREEIRSVGERLGVLAQFKVILGAEDYRRSKPAPEGFLSAARAMRVNPADVLVFEDSQPGITAALAAGMKVVAVAGANHHNQDTSAAHFKIPDMRPVNIDFIRSLEALI
jgi:HAD superfamily hydrolase (TIGR01509 family)